MKLTKEDANLFYSIWFPLLNYVNQTYNVNPHIKKLIHGVSVNPGEVIPIARYLWDHPELIDQYIKKTMPPIEDQDILISWKRFVSGRFFIERFLKRGTVFISENNKVYMVFGTTSEMEENFYYQKPPLLVETTLIPFKGQIISDGLFNTYPIIFGGGMKNTLKDAYMKAKKANKIITEL